MIKTKQLQAEFSWFADMSGGDTEFLGVKDAQRASSFTHCLNILKRADHLGFSGALLPNAYDLGLDPLSFATAAQPHTQQIKTIVALRMGEIYPATLLRMLHTLDDVSQGRFDINVISSDFPGQKTASDYRYERTDEMMQIMIQAWEQDQISFKGNHYDITLDAAPAKCANNKRPLIYFGGISPAAKEVAAKYADVYLMWPEKIEMMADTIQEVSALAARHGREIDFGLRIHSIVRETDAEARKYAQRLISKLDEQQAFSKRAKHQDAHSLGVFRQDELRKQADNEGFIEPLLWSSVGKVFSGCGSAIVGSHKDVVEKIHDYMHIGFRSFVLSGFPLIEESGYFGNLVLPFLPHRPLQRNIVTTSQYHEKVIP